MMKFVALRVLAVVMLTAVVGVGHAAAGLPGEVAHSAMGGSTLMRTTAQLNAWTHWLVDHDNFVELNVSENYGPGKSNGMAGQGSLHWKYDDSNHLFFRVRQNDLGGQASNFMWGGTLDSPFFQPAMFLDDIYGYDEPNALREGQMVNLAWARPLAGGGAFSVGLFIAASGNVYNEVYEDDEDQGEWDWEDVSNAFGAQVTWGNGNGLDVAASFMKGKSSYGWEWEENGEAFDENPEEEANLTLFDLNLRYERTNGWIYQLGAVMGTGTYTENDYSDPDAVETDEVDYKVRGLTANVGRYLLDTDNAAVTAEFFVSYAARSTEVEIEDYDTADDLLVYKEQESALVVPGTRVAFWSQISKRFYLMAGATALWTAQAEKEEGDYTNGDPWTYEETDTYRSMQFYYSGGLAYVPNDRVRIEGQLDMGMLNNLLTLGNRDPLLLRVGGTFTF